VNKGDGATVVKMVAELSEIAGRAGRALQATRTLKRLDGLGQLYYLQKAVATLNAQAEQGNFGRNFEGAKIDPALATQLANAQTVGERERISEAIMNDLASQIPVRWREKVNPFF
jgi:hypothetical protein